MSCKGWALFIALCVIWGIPYLLIRVAVRELSPASLVFLRTAPAALLLLPLAVHRRELRPVLAHWRWVVVFALAELAVPWLLLSHAEQRLSSSMAGLLIATLPLMATILYAALGVSDKPDVRRWAGILIGFAGVAALVGIDVRGSSPLAVAEVLVVCFCYAIGALVISRRLGDLPSLGVITWALGLTALGYAPAGLVALPGSVSTDTVVSVLVLAVVCTAVAFLVFFALIREMGPARSTFITYVNPLVAVLLGVALLDEPFTLGIAVGMPLILVGSLLGTAPPLRGRGVAAQVAPAAPLTGPPAP